MNATTPTSTEPTTAATLPSPPSRALLWAGRVLSGLVVLALCGSALGKLTAQPPVIEMMTAKFGFPAGVLRPLGLVEVTSAILYAIPQTAVLGAVLIAAYLGGAVCTHVRVGEPFVAPIVLGVLAWAGLWLRDPRVRALLPLRR